MSDSILSPLIWEHDYLKVLDQRLLPQEETWLTCRTLNEVIDAITGMAVRGAPAIGIAAAYGAVLALRDVVSDSDEEEVVLRESYAEALSRLQAARPTAVNLAWAVNLVRKEQAEVPWHALEDRLIALAKEIHEQDVQANIQLGDAGSKIMEKYDGSGFSVLTHCNTGSLATGGYGTALGVIRSAWKVGLIDRVYADETRPWLQGARLTAWELQRDNIPVTLNADASAAWLMARENIRWVIVGADRITANGDVANKIGTYSLAVLARHHGLRFMVVAPSSTVDMDLDSGNLIEIEERTERELLELSGQRIAPEGVAVSNPVFDVTPAELIDVIVTDKGVIEQPDLAKMTAVFSNA